MYAIILAAGKGSRMNSHLPKPLIPIAGKSMIRHVIDAVEPLTPRCKICIVHGHQSELMKLHLNDNQLKWAEQTPQIGTGDAVRVATGIICDDAPAMILYGDVPLVTTDTLLKLHKHFLTSRAALTVLTAVFDNPTGYGRIVRNENGAVVSVIEEKDATDAQKLITEVNTGIMVAEGGCLKRWVNSLKNENAQSEYYLTDIVAMAASEECTVTTEVVGNSNEVLGANDLVQLNYLEKLYFEINLNTPI